MIVKILNVVLRPATRAPQLIVTCVDCNLSQPRSERRLVRAMISVERKVGLGKAVLNDIFYLFALREKAARDAGCWMRVLERRTQSSDHPILLAMPETLYLKCFIAEIIY